VVSSKLAIVNDEKLSKRLIKNEQRDTASAERQRSAFQFVTHLIVGDNDRVVSLVSTQITERLKLEWPRNKGNEMWNLMQKTHAMSVATYKTVLSIHNLLQSHLRRHLIPDSFTLEDAIGRTYPVSLQWIFSWEAFDIWLQHRFKDVQGHKKVLRGQYALRDHARQRDIERSQSWTISVLPSQRVGMDPTFQQIGDEEDENSSCQNCKTTSPESISHGVKW